MQELRIKGMYDHPKEVKAARGIKLAAQNLEHAVAGTQMLVARKDDDLEALKEEVMEDMQDIFASVDRSGAPRLRPPAGQYFGGVDNMVNVDLEALGGRLWMVAA